MGFEKSHAIQQLPCSRRCKGTHAYLVHSCACEGHFPASKLRSQRFQGEKFDIFLVAYGMPGAMVFRISKCSRSDSLTTTS